MKDGSEIAAGHSVESPCFQEQDSCDIQPLTPLQHQDLPPVHQPCWGAGGGGWPGLWPRPQRSGSMEGP